MKIMNRVLVLGSFFIIPFVMFGQKENKFIRSGNSSFNDKEYNSAEINYRKALEVNPASQNAIFNLGAALYKQDNIQEAAKSFETLAANNSMKATDRSDAFYNLGNTFLKNKNYKESIECYKNALRLNPSNEDARYNLAYAKQFIDNQQDQQDKNQDQQDKNQDQQKQEQNKNDEQKQDQNQQNQKQDQQQQQQNKQDQQQNKQQQPKELTRKEAEKMLEALKNNEKDSREKVKLEEMKAVRLKSTDKDW